MASHFQSADRDAMTKARAAMPRAWPAFFARFGRLTEVQVHALPLLLDGKNVVLASATASGKTEAVVAPICERLTAGAGLQLLYLVPTRALCNDLERRLKGPVLSLGLQLAVRTGERPELDLHKPQEVVLTTPESFDSILCRAPKVFAPLRAVVLDELHLVDGGYRGDQLRVLLARLRSVRAGALQFAALSATLADPEGMAKRYFDDPVIVRAPGMRSLRLEVAGDLLGALEIFKRERKKKGLVFCNRRADVERAAQELAKGWPRDRLAVHHASLSRQVRERAEASMRSWPYGLCVATTTLEIGLDLGDLDAAILNGAPPTPSGFQQRVGRACRREEAIFAIGVAKADDERALFRRYADLAIKGEVEAREYVADLSVVVQQLFSMLFASPGGVAAEEARALLGLLADQALLARLLAHLEDEGFLTRRAGRLVATQKVMDLGERGSIHSNIPDTRELRVIDAKSGAALGSLLVAAGAGDRLFFAGRAFEVVGAGKGALRVQAVEGGEGKAPTFAARDRGAFTRYLPPDLGGPGKRRDADPFADD